MKIPYCAFSNRQTTLSVCRTQLLSVCRTQSSILPSLPPHFLLAGLQYMAIMKIAEQAMVDAGGTVTHHHALGRDHRPWYDKERPELFCSAMKAAKNIFDPHAILNPGVLFDPS